MVSLKLQVAVLSETQSYNLKMNLIIFVKQGSNHLFRSDPQKFSEQFQQLGGMGEGCKLPIWGYGATLLSKRKK